MSSIGSMTGDRESGAPPSGTDDMVGTSRDIEPRFAFAWGYFAAIMLGLLVIVAVICSIATLLPKQEAKFSGLTALSNAA